MPKLNHAINVTPLADVMLVLLIIFMVVTPLMDQSVAVDVPEAANPTEHPNDDGTLILALKGGGSIWLNESSVPRAEAEARVREALDRRETKVLYVKASASLDYGWVLEMMDVCRRAGAEEVALITKETVEERPTSRQEDPKAAARPRS